MCGIAGIFSHNKIHHESLDRMVKAMKKRGPDGLGVWMNEEKTCALGHTRLSIIDLSKSADQPMSILDGRYTITYNGEVYNYKQLKVDLETRGAKFKSDSDTEVILWGWHYYGNSFVHRIRGMFAFCLRDEKQKRSYLVRDRLGIKPLIYTAKSDRIIFASSISALLASGEVEKKINQIAIYDLFCMGAVAQPRTIIENVYALRPGSIITICEDLSMNSELFWNLSEPKVEAIEKKSFLQVVQELRSKLEEACQYHMVADVPVGSFMSGGVDSTAITALMTKLTGERINTFTIGFETKGKNKDELSEASLAAAYIGTNHHEILLKDRDVANDFDNFISAIDQPSIDGLNTYWVSKVASNVVKVALSGLGADEIFAGYDSFLMMKRASISDASCLDYLFGRIYPQISNRFTFKSAFKISDSKLRETFFRRVLRENELLPLLSKEFKSELDPNHFRNYVLSINTKSNDAVNQYSKYELQAYVLNILMRDADSLSMGNSLEVRPIYLDHELVEFSLSLPGELKLHNNITKAALKEATRDLLPPGFFDKRKIGFSLPIFDWINAELKPIVYDSLFSSTSADYFDLNALNNLLKHAANPYYTNVIWLTTVITSWMNKTLN